MEANTNSFPRPVMLNDGQRLLRIDLADVAYVEADRMYCKVHMRDGKKTYTLGSPLNTVEASFPGDTFVRIHRSFIINIWRVQMVIGRMVKLDTGNSFTVGETYRNVFEGRFLVLGEKGS